MYRSLAIPSRHTHNIYIYIYIKHKIKNLIFEIPLYIFIKFIYQVGRKQSNHFFFFTTVCSFVGCTHSSIFCFLETTIFTSSLIFLFACLAILFACFLPNMCALYCFAVKRFVLSHVMQHQYFWFPR